MRSSKSRSRSKSNRPRPLGNIVNRVFDSSGPEGKVRGTPQQIIDKYLQLARDAQLGNDRVAAENFLQHAEHYTRMLAEAQREIAREAEQRRDRNDPQGQPQGNGQPGRQPRSEDQPQPRRAPVDPSVAVIDFDDREIGLVETPEAQRSDGSPEAPAPTEAAAPAKPADKPAARATASPDASAEAAGEPAPSAPKPATRRRAVRKPKAPAQDSAQTADTPAPSDQQRPTGTD